MNNITRSTATDGQQSQSLMTAINRFVQAVNTMDDTVMIPCRLRDMQVEGMAVPDIEENNNNKAVVSALPVKGDLYNFYAMLHAIRREIIAGPSLINDDDANAKEVDDNGNENDPTNENARKTASAFRFHLRGLFGLLHQMTETAKYLSSRYENDVTTSQTGISSVSSFNM